MRKAIPIFLLLALLLIARRREQVTTTVSTGPVFDWWDYWYATGGQ